MAAGLGELGGSLERASSTRRAVSWSRLAARLRTRWARRCVRPRCQAPLADQVIPTPLPGIQVEQADVRIGKYVPVTVRTGGDLFPKGR
jgi:hypothetical protein